ncbi:hypothetical protein HPB49_019663 [Dermacentor silvarum]|uniref:Uncharacterized protein n=1 Tax=Dermacentor silvarum TaxID=543639 RepID=A0ACB8DF72_DERSI|nr:hypothetical protein HPB49_019663 [Dermacentor silvarum]
MEKIVTTRFSHHLEDCGYFHPFQTGFRPQLGPQGSVYLLHTTIDRERKFCRGRLDALVAVDLKKVFDTIGHPAIIIVVESTQAGTRMVSLVKGSLEDRTYEFQLSPGHLARQFTNTLFNVVMATIA